MKPKTTLIIFALLSLSPLFAQAAKELTKDQASHRVPYSYVMIDGHFNSLDDTSDAASRAADERGADYFYIRDADDEIGNHGGNSRVTIDLYRKADNQ